MVTGGGYLKGHHTLSALGSANDKNGPKGRMKAGTILAAGQLKIKVLMRLSVICCELQAVVPL